MKIRRKFFYERQSSGRFRLYRVGNQGRPFCVDGTKNPFRIFLWTVLYAELPQRPLDY